jgi:Protein of unknown function (DUF2934)
LKLKEQNMAGIGTEKSNPGSLEAEEKLREEMGQREDGRRAHEQNEQQDLNQGMATGTHSSAHAGIHWGPSYRMRSKIEQPLPTKEQIEARAYELYLQHERKDGQDLEHWLIAEDELKREHLKAN